MLRSILLVGAALIAAPLAAQTSPADQPSRPLNYDPGHDSDSARSNAIAARTAPGVADANRSALGQSRANGGPVSIDETRYAADMARYRAALRAHRRAVNRDAAVEARQERAYAMAMADWRAQVRACDRGHTRACRAPAPNPANYW